MPRQYTNALMELDPPTTRPRGQYMVRPLSPGLGSVWYFQFTEASAKVRP